MVVACMFAGTLGYVVAQNSISMVRTGENAPLSFMMDLFSLPENLTFPVTYTFGPSTPSYDCKHC